MHITSRFKQFAEHESFSGILLIILTVLTLVCTNIFWGESYSQFWNFEIGKPLIFWVNDVLMTLFFLYVGFEIEREFYVGELSNFKQALLPVVAAIGGMLVPAIIYVTINMSHGTLSGFGIPMATDIAFSITMLTLVSNRIPPSLKVFLTALAIIDDLGAIIVIALFYTHQFSILFFIISLFLILLLYMFNQIGYQYLNLYLLFGIFLWFCLYKTGIHPTITGVILAFVIPFNKNPQRSLSHKLQNKLHAPVTYVILPLFVLANTGIIISQNSYGQIFTVNSIGIILGLVVGKPLGITLFSFLAIKFKICQMFSNLTFKHIFGAGLLAGIGFTMAIFLSNLAFSENNIVSTSIIAIIIASILSSLLGLSFFIISFKKRF